MEKGGWDRKSYPMNIASVGVWSCSGIFQRCDLRRLSDSRESASRLPVKVNRYLVRVVGKLSLSLSTTTMEG